MGFWSGTKKTVGFVINIRVDQWIGLADLKASFLYFLNFSKNLFKIEKKEKTETFEEAIDRLKITEEQLKDRKKEFMRLFLIYSMLSILLFCYAIYLAIFKNNWPGTTITFALVIYTLINAFRFHFWIFQINHRKLGCSIKSWFNNNPDH